MNNYQIEKMEVNDEEISKYLDLFERCFGYRHSPEWFNWKYLNNPFTESPTIIVAKDEKDRNIIGARSFFGMKVSFFSDIIWGLQPCDTMVLPRYRRQGIFTAMNEFASAEISDSKCDIIFNFPSQKIVDKSIEMGWEKVGEIPTYYHLSNNNYLSEIFPDKNSNLYVTKNGDVEDINNINNRNDRISNHYSTKYFEWRLANPEKNYHYIYESDEVIALTMENNASNTEYVTISMISPTLSDDIFVDLIKNVMRYHKGDKLRVREHEILDSKELYTNGFIKDTLPLINKYTNTTVLLCKIINEKYEVEDAYNINNWEVQYIDQDVG